MKNFICEIRNLMILVVVMGCYPNFCSAERAVLHEIGARVKTYVEPHRVYITEEGIFISSEDESGLTKVDHIFCDSAGLFTIHKHKIYCLKCLGCDPNKHIDCKSRCKCKHPKLR